jgi:hypothetical protein
MMLSECGRLSSGQKARIAGCCKFCGLVKGPRFETRDIQHEGEGPESEGESE